MIIADVKERSLKWLQMRCDSEDAENGCGVTTECNSCLIAEAIEQVKKSIPTKPIARRGDGWPVCPSCGNRIVLRPIDNHTTVMYCYRCGQSIEMGNDNEKLRSDRCFAECSILRGRKANRA